MSADQTPLSFAWRIALFYSAIFIVLGVSLPYFPLWLQWQGLSAFEIGLVTSVPLFIRIAATPMIGFAADRAQSVRRIVVIAAAVAIAFLVRPLSEQDAYDKLELRQEPADPGRALQAVVVKPAQTEDRADRALHANRALHIALQIIVLLKRHADE